MRSSYREVGIVKKSETDDTLLVLFINIKRGGGGAGGGITGRVSGGFAKCQSISSPG